MSMKWTKDLPTKPGWYWVKPDLDMAIKKILGERIKDVDGLPPYKGGMIEVIEVGGCLVIPHPMFPFPFGRNKPVENFFEGCNPEWAGPIPYPEDS
jgi:hypothetical protein